MNVNQIELALSQKISASSTNFDLLAAAKALQLLKTNGVFVVSSYGGLPAAASNEGKIYFIENIETVVWSNGTDWLRLLDKSVPQIPTQMWVWGSNQCGRLGDGTTVNKCSPVREFCSAANWCQVDTGFDHSIAVKTSGELWAWGRNSRGEIGNGTITQSCSPVREISSSTDWCQVSSGCALSAALKTSGEMWLWGCAANGALGDGTTISQCSPVREFYSAIDWCQVNVARSIGIAVKTTGELWAWGTNYAGQLGDGTQTSRCSPVREITSSTDWCQVSARSILSSTISAIKTDGTLWSWGGNSCGSLGDGTTLCKCSPVREISSSTDWCQVSLSTAVKTSGQIWAWGNNYFGRIGDGTQTTRLSPVREFCSATDWCQVSAGSSHTAAIKTSGQIWAWGYNRCGRLGDGTVDTRCSPVREITSSTDWCQARTSVSHVLAIKVL